MPLTQGITNFIKFSERPPKKFIELIWQDSEDLETVKGLFFRRSFCDFFLRLNSDNKQKLVDYIEENYTF